MGHAENQERAHASPVPAYFRRLTMANVRCFGPEVELDLSHDDRPAKWTVLLGDNGVGKTTVLQCLFSMAPLVGHDTKGSTPPRGGRVPQVMPSLARSSDTELRVDAEMAFDTLLSRMASAADQPTVARAHIIHGGEHGGYQYYPGIRDCMCCAYGALRREDAGSLDSEGPHSGSGISLFLEDQGLASASEWYLRTDYAARSSSDRAAKTRLELVRSTLVDLLPEVEDIRIAGLDASAPRPRVEAQTPYGWVPIRALSLGYRSMIAWVVDLAVRMFEAFPDLDNPLEGPAVVLVDEIDLHLHPRWQREITTYLDQRLPNVQFVVTAHSPLVVQADGITNVAVLRRVGDHVEIINDPEEVRGWRVDQILTSDLFGLSGARSPDTERLLARQEELALLDAPTEDQRDELRDIDAQLAALGPGETARDREAWRVIRDLSGRLQDADPKP